MDAFYSSLSSQWFWAYFVLDNVGFFYLNLFLVHSLVWYLSNMDCNGREVDFGENNIGV